MNIEYYKKNVYGKELLYIKDESLAKAIEKLTGKKTIDKDAIEALKRIEVKFIQVLP